MRSLRADRSIERDVEVTGTAWADDYATWDLELIADDGHFNRQLHVVALTEDRPELLNINITVDGNLDNAYGINLDDEQAIALRDVLTEWICRDQPEEA